MSIFTANKKLFDTKEYSDVTFIIHGKEIHAHKLFLMNRSPVLKAMIKGPMAPADQRHVINDPQVSYNDFENFLKFLYTDECEIDSDNVERLLRLSHIYDVPFLFETCVNRLPQFLSPTNYQNTNLYKFAELGLLYQNKFGMLSRCFYGIENYAKNSSLQYRKQEKWIWISAELALEFVKSCPRTDAFTENDVFKKVYDWAKGQCDLHNLEINAVNIKKFMDPLEKYIKYENISVDILAIKVQEMSL